MKTRRHHPFGLQGLLGATLLATLGCGSSGGPAAGLCPALDPITSWNSGTLHTGAVDAPETWTAAASPHKIVGTLDVNAAITVEPCGIVLFAPTDGGGETILDLHAKGQFLAQGSADKPILMKGLRRDDGSAEENGIAAIEATGEVVRFAHVTFEGSAKSSDLSGSYFVRLVGLGERGSQQLHVEHVTLRDGYGGGIFLSKAAVFTKESTDLTVTGMRALEGLREDTNMPLTAPVHFDDAQGVSTLPSGSYAGNVTDHVAVGIFGSGDTHIDDGAHVWRDTGVPYYMLSKLFIAGTGGPTLTLEAGVTLQWTTGESDSNRGGIDVGYADEEGTLLVQGSADRKVTMEGVTDDPGAWEGIEFFPKGAGSRLDHLILRHTGNGSNTSIAHCTDPSMQWARFAVGINFNAEPGMVPEATMIQNVTIENALAETAGIARGWIAKIDNCDSVDFLSGQGNEVVGLSTPQTAYTIEPMSAPSLCCP